MGEVSSINTYLLSPDQLDKITIYTTPEGRGWLMQVLFPHRTSGDDKIKMLNWMMDYRSSIKQSYPLWDVSFFSKTNRYFLLITPEGCDADMRRTARDKANALFEDVIQSYGR